MSPAWGNHYAAGGSCEPILLFLLGACSCTRQDAQCGFGAIVIVIKTVTVLGDCCPTSSEPAPQTHSGCPGSSPRHTSGVPRPPLPGTQAPSSGPPSPGSAAPGAPQPAGSETPPLSGSGPSLAPGSGWRRPVGWVLQPPKASSSAETSGSGLIWLFCRLGLLRASPHQSWPLGGPFSSEPLESCHAPGSRLQRRQDRSGVTRLHHPPRILSFLHSSC